MNKWKQIVAVSMVSLIAAATMAQDYTTTQQSRRLAVDNPENTYILGTDGKYNHWYSRASLMASVTVTITKQTGAVTASGTVTPAIMTNVTLTTQQVVVSASSKLGLVTNVTIATTIAAATNGTISSFANPTNIDNSVTVAVATNGTISSFANPTNIQLTKVSALTNLVISYTNLLVWNGYTTTTETIYYMTTNGTTGSFEHITAFWPGTETVVAGVVFDQRADVASDASLQTETVTPTFTPQTASVLSSATLQTATVTPTFTPQTANAVASVGLETTDALGSGTLGYVVSGVTPQRVSSAAVTVSVVGGGAVMTNATASVP